MALYKILFYFLTSLAPLQGTGRLDAYLMPNQHHIEQQEGATTDVAAPSCCLPHSAYEKDDPSVAKGRAAFCYTAFFGFFMNTFCQNIKNTAYLSDKRIRKTFLGTLKDFSGGTLKIFQNYFGGYASCQSQGFTPIW